MADGRAAGRLEAALGVVGILALGISYALLTGWNPVPGFLDWLHRLGSLSRPEPAWDVRSAERPEYAVIAGSTVIVILPGGVEARRADGGEEIWSRAAPWAAVAGADTGAVVVVGRENQRGFDVVDPASGAVRWSDDEAAGVWTYRQAVLALTCQRPDRCSLAGRDPGGGRVRWRTELPGGGRVLAGLNRELPGSRDISLSTMDSRLATPADMPVMLGFPVDRTVHVVHTGTGRRVGTVELGHNSRVVVVGGRLLYSTVEHKGGRCRYLLEARDPASGRSVWRREGYDLRTASGAGCDQRRDPSGGGGALAAIRGDNREVLLHAASGVELWVGASGERLLGTDGLVALVRAADGASVKAVDLGTGGTLWHLATGRDAEASLTRYAALVVEEGRLRAVEVGTGRVVVDVRTTAHVVGSGPAGLVLSSGRSIGLLPFGSVSG